VTYVLTPVQAAEFSGAGKQAVVLYAPDWAETILPILQSRPAAYEADWHYDPDRKAYVLTVTYEGAQPFAIALVDGVHGPVLAKVAGGAALVLSPYPLFPDEATENAGEAAPRYFDPTVSLLLPSLPNPLGSSQ
jgi:hypothetical protein